MTPPSPPPPSSGPAPPSAPAIARARPFFWIALAVCIAHGPSLADDPVHDDIGQLYALLDPPRSALEAYVPNPILERLVPHRHPPGEPVGVVACLITAAEPWWQPANRVWRPGARVLLNLQRLAGTKAGMGDSLLVLRASTLALHLAACLAVLWLARSLRLPEAAGLATALVLAVHPLRQEAIHQLVGQTELLAAFGMAAGLALRLRARDALDTLPPDAGTGRRRRAFARVVAGDCAAFALALSGKEHAILYPLYAMLCEAARRAGPCPGRPALPETPARARMESFAPELASCIALACVAVAYLAAKAAVTGGLAEPPTGVPHHENAIARLPFAERIAPALGILGFACSKLALPLGLAHDYSAISLPLASGWRWGMAWLGGAVLLAALWFAARDFRRGGRGWTLVVASLAAWGMTSNLPFPIGVAAAPRLWYFPMIGPTLGACVLWERWRRRTRESSRASEDPAFRRRPDLAMFATVALLSAVSLKHAPEWRDVHRWMEALYRVHPESYRANHFLAARAWMRRDYDEGIERARDAIRASPDVYEPYVLLGFNASAFVETRAEAEAAFREALRLQPGAPDALAGLERLRAGARSGGGR